MCYVLIRQNDLHPIFWYTDFRKSPKSHRNIYITTTTSVIMTVVINNK